MEAVGAVVLKAAVGFLFSQATHLLKRWAERRQQPDASAVESMPVDLEDDILQGQLLPVEVHWDDAKQVIGKIEELWSALAPYANGVKELTVKEPVVTKSVDQLRDLLEAIYGQRMTFTGENRESSGTTIVRGDIEAALVKGTAGGVVTD